MYRKVVSWQIVARLVPDDLQPGDEFGASVDMDGEVIIVGAPGYNTDPGSAYVFRRNVTSGEWNLDTKLAPVDSALGSFGRDVSVRGDTVAVGDKHHGARNACSVFMYEYDSQSGAWDQLQDNIINAD